MEICVPVRRCTGKQSACQWRRCMRHRFDPCIGKIPLRRKWQPAREFLPGKFHGQRSLVGYSPWVRKESDTTEWLHFTSLHLFNDFNCKSEISSPCLYTSGKDPSTSSGLLSVSHHHSGHLGHRGISLWRAKENTQHLPDVKVCRSYLGTYVKNFIMALNT